LLKFLKIVVVVIVEDDIVTASSCTKSAVVTLKVKIPLDRINNYRINNQTGLEVNIILLVILLYVLPASKFFIGKKRA
jgi:hypothetical protein